MNSILNENFNTALNIYNNDYSHENLICFLKTGTATEKQISALKLDLITSIDDAETLLANLTGQDGKVREAIAFKFNEFCQNNDYKKHFYSEKNYDILLDAIIDINGNVCRNVISAISKFKDNQDFCIYFCNKLSQNATKLIQKVGEFEMIDGKYKVNKEVFKLYWYLETIYEFYEKIDSSSLKIILSKTKNINDYTIREKTAKILTKNSNNNDLLKIQQELRQDPNYYVRRF